MRLIVQGRMGLTTRAALEYRLEANRPRCVGRLIADIDSHLYRFRFPDWRVGDGSFGESYVQDAMRRYFARGTFNGNYNAIFGQQAR